MASWTSLVGQWLGLCASSAGGLVSIPGWGIKIPDTKQSDKKKKKDLAACRRMLVCADASPFETGKRRRR